MRLKISNIIYTALLIWLCYPYTLQAQQVAEGKLIIDHLDPKEGQIGFAIKWMGNDEVFYGRKRMNLYRQEEGGDWQRVNPAPLNMGSYRPSDAIIRNDSDLETLISLAEQTANKGEDLNGAGLLFFAPYFFLKNEFALYMGQQYYDREVQSGKRYRYKAVVLSPNSSERIIGVSSYLEAGVFQPAAPPTGISSYPTDSAIYTVWEPEVERYYGVNVYRKDSISDWKKLNKQPIYVYASKDEETGTDIYPAIFYADEKLEENKTYIYKYQAVDFFAREGGFSKDYPIKTQDITPPLPPLNTAITGLDDDVFSLTMEWEGPSKIDDDVIGYRVYRSNNGRSGDDFKVVQPLLPLSQQKYTDTPGRPGIYFYRISTVDRAGNEAAGPLVYETLKDKFPPAPPQNLQAIADTGTIRLSWSPIPDKDFLGYIVYRAPDKANEDLFVPLNPTRLLTTSFVDTLPKITKNSFVYRVVAVDSSYNKSKPSATVAAKMPDVTPPNPPFVKGIRLEEGIVSVTWMPVRDEDLAGYKIYRATEDDSTNFTQVNVSLYSKEAYLYKDRLAPKNKQLYYYVTALDSVGNQSLPSNTYAAHLHDLGEGVDAGKVKAVYDKRSKGVALQWGITEGDNYLGCVIFRKEDRGGLAALTGLIKDGNSYVDKATKPGNNYQYQLRFYTKTGKMTKSELIEVKVKK